MNQSFFQTRNRRIASAYVISAALMALAGCGGGGGGNTGSPGGGRVAVFASDAFSEDYDQVWVTIHKVELLNASGASETVFDDAASGRVLNLSRLHDASGPRFALLGGAATGGVGANATQVRVTLGETVSLFGRGQSAGRTTPVDPSVPRDGRNRPVVTFGLATPRASSGSDNVVIDFDLAHFAVVNGAVAPALREGEKTGLENQARHETGDYRGTVTNGNGAAPAQTFTLTRPNGETLAVATSATTVFSGRGGASGTLPANGARVEVRGVFDATTGKLNARSIKSEDGENETEIENEAQIVGAPSGVNAGAGTFAVSVARARGFVPTQARVTVVTNAATVYRAFGGVLLTQTALFTSLAAAPAVEIEGTYDAATNTLTAHAVGTEGAEAEGTENENESGDHNGGNSGSHDGSEKGG